MAGSNTSPAHKMLTAHNWKNSQHKEDLHLDKGNNKIVFGKDTLHGLAIQSVIVSGIIHWWHNTLGMV